MRFLKLFTACFCTTLLVFFPLFAQAALTTNLVGYWKFDESSGNAFDSTANAYTLTNKNTATYGAAKINNGAIMVRASDQGFDRTLASGVANLQVTGNLTIAGWVYFTTVPASGAYYILVWLSTGNDGAGGYNWYMGNNAGTLQFQFETQQGTPITSHNNLVNWTPTAATWYHVAVTYNTSGSNNVKFYVNGVQQGTTQTDTHTSIGVSSVYGYMMGNLSELGTNVNPLDGKLDEWGIWSRELSASEISQLYNSGTGLSYPFSSPAASPALINSIAFWW